MHNLKYLLLIRIISIGAQVLALLVMKQLFHLNIDMTALVLIISGLIVMTFLSWITLRHKTEVKDEIYLAHLVIDVAGLSLLIYFTGGSVNPFIFLFILPIIFAASSIRPVYTGLITLLAIMCYTLLMFFHIPIHQGHTQHQGIQLHIWGMWYGFIISAGLIAFFVSRIALTLRNQDLALAAAREEKLSNEQVIALGTLAAGTAHELGTPLSTIAVLSSEIQQQYQSDNKLSDDLQIMRKQIQRCKNILAKMSSDAGQLQAQTGHVESIEIFLQNLVTQWQQLRTKIHIMTSLSGVEPVPHIVADRSLTHAIVNILNNAADASVGEIQLRGSWTEKDMLIEIYDDGTGVTDSRKQKLGQTIASNKTPGEGLGIGLFLAQTIINRFGGHIDYINRENGGLLVKVALPLTQLSAENR